MDKVNQDYWYNQWHLDFELHTKMFIKNVTKISENEPVSIYADTDSVFVSFEPAIKHSEWRNNILRGVDKFKKSFVILEKRQETKTDNPNCKGVFNNVLDLVDFLNRSKVDNIIIDGYFVKDRDLRSSNNNFIFNDFQVAWNWENELDFIQGLDYFRYADFFKKCLEEYADGFGVENKEDFELERISESIINISKKKYIQHIVFEDGIPYDRLSYIFPKGVELVRSSTPAFARDKIVSIVKYLFSHPDTFNIKDLLKLVKNLRREFELADIDDISMQSSVSKYDDKVLDDKDKLSFVSGAHFAVKAAAYHNYLLHKDKDLQSKYEFIKSGSKIKYYYCKNNRVNNMFAYLRGSHPIEFAPEVDFDEQFSKSILSPINSIIDPLGLPQITKRLSVVLDIFSALAEENNKPEEERVPKANPNDMCPCGSGEKYKYCHGFLMDEDYE